MLVNAIIGFFHFLLNFSCLWLFGVILFSFFCLNILWMWIMHLTCLWTWCVKIHVAVISFCTNRWSWLLSMPVTLETFKIKVAFPQDHTGKHLLTAKYWYDSLLDFCLFSKYRVECTWGSSDNYCVCTFVFQKATLFLITAAWPSQAWFPLLFQWSLKHPLCLSLRHDLFSSFWTFSFC